MASLRSAPLRAAGLLVSLALLALPLGGAARAATAGPAPDDHASLPHTIVVATMTDDMRIALDRYSVSPGWVDFLVTNRGKIVHEIVVLKTDLPLAQLPADPDEADKVVEEVHMGEAEVDAGRFSGTEMLLGPGRYVLICNEPGHYAAGMRTEFWVVQPAVNVALNDNMTISLDRSTVFAGPIVFAVTNAGKITHEFVVFQTDLEADQIPADPNEPGMVDEQWNIGETGDIPAGRFSGLGLTLDPGHYLLICNDPGHFAAGMHISFTVLPLSAPNQ
jgi:uncharacterized cupredoxin-like copper-binding protein